jgi:CBS-domain-containing membrane protein
MTALARKGQSATVRDVMQREFQTARPTEEADAVFGRLQTADCRSLPVLDRDRLVGMVTAENLGEFLMIQSALQGKRRVGAKI